MQGQDSPARAATVDVVFILTSFEGQRVSSTLPLNEQIDKLRFRLMPDLLAQKNLCEAHNIQKIRFFYLGRELRNGEVLSDLTNGFCEANFKEMVVHTQVTLKASILPQMSAGSSTKHSELPLEKGNLTQHDCIKCRIF